MRRNLINLITKYFYFGIISACIEITFFFLLIKYLNYIFANTMSYCFGILTSFALNRIYNFKIKDKVIKRFSRFFLVNIVVVEVAFSCCYYYCFLLLLLK